MRAHFNRREQQLKDQLFLAWHVAAFNNSEKLPDLEEILKKPIMKNPLAPTVSEVNTELSNKDFIQKALKRGFKVPQYVQDSILGSQPN